MSDETFYIKAGNTAPAIRVILKYPDGDPVNITGHTSLRFHLRGPDGVNVVDADATANDEAAGDVQYSWSNGDTDTPGLYRAEWEVTYASGKIETFPNFGYQYVHIDGVLA